MDIGQWWRPETGILCQVLFIIAATHILLFADLYFKDSGQSSDVLPYLLSGHSIDDYSHGNIIHSNVETSQGIYSAHVSPTEPQTTVRICPASRMLSVLDL
jgi:hypothetical protein